MSTRTLYLNWDYNGILWKGYDVVSSVPDLDGSVRQHLENHVEQYFSVAQLHVDYLEIYITHEGAEAVLPPPCVMRASNGGTITVHFSFKRPQ